MNTATECVEDTSVDTFGAQNARDKKRRVRRMYNGREDARRAGTRQEETIKVKKMEEETRIDNKSQEGKRRIKASHEDGGFSPGPYLMRVYTIRNNNMDKKTQLKLFQSTQCLDSEFTSEVPVTFIIIAHIKKKKNRLPGYHK